MKDHDQKTSSPAPEDIEGCFNGRPGGQKIIYEFYYKRMYTICLRYAGNADEAKDLLHDGFLKLFDKMQGKPEISNLDGWIRKLFHNHCLDYVRSAYKKYIVYQDQEDFSDSDTHHYSEEEDYLNRFSNEELLAALNKLRPDYRVILNLYAVESLSHSQIGELLGIQESSSRSKLMRARKQLKSLMNMP